VKLKLAGRKIFSWGRQSVGAPVFFEELRD
jgi:hypothetical protein